MVSWRTHDINYERDTCYHFPKHSWRYILTERESNVLGGVFKLSMEDKGKSSAGIVLAL